MAEAAVIGAMSAMQIAQGAMQQSSLNKEAAAYDENARRTDTQGAFDAVDALRKSRMQEGIDITSAAASGSGLTGSVADLLESNAVERQLEAMNIRYSANQQATSIRMQAAQKRADGRAALLGGIFRAGAAAIQGASGFGNSNALAGAQSRSQAQAMGTIPVPMGGN